MAERYAAGRHTIRAALAQLSSEGLLVHDRNRGARVREFTRADINDAFDLREALEVAAIRIICRDRPDLTALSAAVDELDAYELADAGHPGTTASWQTLDADRAVHQAMIDATGSSRIARAYATITNEIHYCYSILRVTAMPPDEQEHRAIFSALVAADAEAALAIIVPHLEEGREQCLSALPIETA